MGAGNAPACELQLPLTMRCTRMGREEVCCLSLPAHGVTSGVPVLLVSTGGRHALICSQNKPRAKAICGWIMRQGCRWLAGG